MWPHGAGHRQRGAGLAGGLGSSVILASDSLRRIFLSVHRPAQDPDLSPSGPAGGPILGNLPSGRGRSTSPHQPGEKCAAAGEGHALSHLVRTHKKSTSQRVLGPGKTSMLGVGLQVRATVTS